MDAHVPQTVFGIDFTSAPTARKPITCARAIFDEETFRLVELVRWHDFEEFEAALAAPGPWVAGVDFPFGQARTFIENIGWPRSWADYVGLVATLDRGSFRETLEDYKRHRAPGDKHHKRNCDVISRAQSSQTLYGTPVGLMFFEGAPRLLKAGVHLPYNHDGDADRVVLEAYPGIVARQLIGNRSYKNDAPSKQTAEQLDARTNILRLLTGPRGRDIYGFSIEAPAELAEDPGADDLDALLCAVQAAWGWSRRSHGFGAPPGLDRLEGWICDPALS
ncbi:MAG: DUF429 domain-containing protein [Woeseiaceae bacterium]|nr:DUF429 domain-containing protein [Woeseiaceae bacterium]